MAWFNRAWAVELIERVKRGEPPLALEPLKALASFAKLRSANPNAMVPAEIADIVKSLEADRASDDDMHRVGLTAMLDKIKARLPTMDDAQAASLFRDVFGLYIKIAD